MTGKDFNNPVEIRYSAGVNRQVRRVPLDWQHSRSKYGYKPLFDHVDFERDVVSYREDDPSLTRELIESWYMPDFSNIPKERMGIMAYETVTEGTPISPAFPDSPKGRFELARHCMDNSSVFADYKCPSIEAWVGILYSRTTAMSDIEDGTVTIRPQADLQQDKF